MKDINLNDSQWYRIEKFDIMTMMDFFCCAAIGFSGAIAMFVFTIAGNPIRMLILIMSAFCWLFSLIASSILYYIIPVRSFFLFHVVSSVLIQECFRLFAYNVLSSIKASVRRIMATPAVSILPTAREIAYVSGLGFGIMSASMQLVNTLSLLKGPGTVGLNGGSENFGLVSATISSLLVILHTSWSVISFTGYRKKLWRLPIYVVVIHSVVSCCTVLLVIDELSYLTMPIIMIITLASCWYSYIVSGGSINLFCHAIYRSIFTNRR